MSNFKKEFARDALKLNNKAYQTRQSIQVQKAMGIAAVGLGTVGLIGSGLGIVGIAGGTVYWAINSMIEKKNTGRFMPIPWSGITGGSIAANGIQAAQGPVMNPIVDYDHLSLEDKADYVLRTTLLNLSLKVLEGKEEDEAELMLTEMRSTLIKYHSTVLKDPVALTAGLYGSAAGFSGAYAKMLPSSIKELVPAEIIDSATAAKMLHELEEEDFVDVEVIETPMIKAPEEPTYNSPEPQTYIPTVEPAYQVTEASAFRHAPINIPSVEVEEVAPLKFYDLKDISGETHTAVIGPSGSGKSFLTQHIVSEYFDESSEIIALDTDASPEEWGGLPVVGRGCNIPAIRRHFEADLSELQKRTKLREVGKPVGPEKVRIVEEFPNLAAEMSDLITEENREVPKGEPKAATDAATNWLKKLLRRGRKYKMKIVLVSQEFEVKSLKIDGEGSLRKAFTVIYLSATAIEKASYITDKDERTNVLNWLKQQERPALVDVGGQLLPCEIPFIEKVVQKVSKVEKAVIFTESPKSEVFEPTSDEILPTGTMEKDLWDDAHRGEENTDETVDFLGGTKKTMVQATDTVARYLSKNEGKDFNMAGIKQAFASRDRASLEPHLKSIAYELNRKDSNRYMIRDLDGELNICYQSDPLSTPSA